ETLEPAPEERDRLAEPESVSPDRTADDTGGPSDTPDMVPPRPEVSGVETGSAPQAEQRRAPAWIKPVALTALLIAIVPGGLWGVRYWRYAGSHVSTDDAYLTAHVVQRTPQG